MMTVDTDRIRKTAVLRAPLARVWAAISDATQFGTWFGAEFDGPFVPGARVGARIVPTKVDTEVAKLQEPHAGTAFDVLVERVEPMRLLSFRWRPYPVDSEHLATAPTTLVEFELTEAPDGTTITITESGYLEVPLDKRANAFKGNEEGWSHQLRLLEKYLVQRT